MVVLESLALRTKSRDAGFISDDYSEPSSVFAESLGVTSSVNDWGMTGLDASETGGTSIEDYTAMAEGYDGRTHVERLRQMLAPGSAVLELGMGPGVDLYMLAKTFAATGSDRSQAFLDRYALIQPEADLLQLDAATVDTDRRFDAIYSNKVLHHLTRHELRRSLERQASLRRPGGLLLHGLWDIWLLHPVGTDMQRLQVHEATLVAWLPSNTWPGSTTTSPGSRISRQPYVLPGGYGPEKVGPLVVWVERSLLRRSLSRFLVSARATTW